MEEPSDPRERRLPPYLRLVWSRDERAAADYSLPSAKLPPLPPCRPANLAVVIESHLSGADGLSDEIFLQVFSGRRAGR